MTEKKPEDFSEFQKRVFAAESHYGLGFLPHVRALSVIGIVAGLVLIAIHRFVFYHMLLYNIGAILAGIGIIVVLLIYWIDSGTGVLIKERLKSIQERGMSARCFYLKGDLPDGLSPWSGHCELYNKDLVSYPYCIYCKSYITKKQMEEKKLKVEIE